MREGLSDSLSGWFHSPILHKKKSRGPRIVWLSLVSGHHGDKHKIGSHVASFWPWGNCSRGLHRDLSEHHRLSGCLGGGMTRLASDEVRSGISQLSRDTAKEQKSGYKVGHQVFGVAIWVSLQTISPVWELTIQVSLRGA